MRPVRALFRRLMDGIEAFGGRLRLLNWQLRYGGISAGRRVRVGRGVTMITARGGTIVIGDDVILERGVHLAAEVGRLEIGAHSYVGRGAVVVAIERVSIGADALIADYVTIRDQNHGTVHPDLPYRSQELTSRPIELGANVWIGAGAAVLAGASIGEGCVIGANSVATGSLPARSVCVGAPARAIRKVDQAARGESGP
jgi:acetyltransferase-like isoleucine patch superfamily enzyme